MRKTNITRSKQLNTLKSIKMKQEDRLLSQLNVEKDPKQKSVSLIMNEPIENTPFRMIGNDEQGFFIAIAHYRLTPAKKTIDEAYAQLEQNHWIMVLRLIDAVIDMNKNGELTPMTKQKFSEIKPEE